MENKSYEKIIKDFQYPIPLIPENYEYLFDLYENILGTKTTLSIAEKESKDFDFESLYFEYIKNTMLDIISTVKETSAFAKFNNEKNEDFFVSKGIPKFHEKVCDFNFTKKTDVYSSANVDKKFISIDLEKANFQICRKYDEGIVLGAKTYEELVEKFTPSKYFARSKHIRQIIFGNIAPERQRILEKYYTGKILNFLIENNFFSLEDIKVYTHDEIVIQASEYLSEIRTKEIYDAILNEFGLRTHIESYTIKEIFHGYFARVQNNGEVAFKGVPPYLFAQVYKKYFDLEVEKRDLMFLFESIPSYFTKTLDGKIL